MRKCTTKPTQGRSKPGDVVRTPFRKDSADQILMFLHSHRPIYISATVLNAFLFVCPDCAENIVPKAQELILPFNCFASTRSKHTPLFIFRVRADGTSHPYKLGEYSAEEPKPAVAVAVVAVVVAAVAAIAAVVSSSSSSRSSSRSSSSIGSSRSSSSSSRGKSTSRLK